MPKHLEIDMVRMDTLNLSPITPCREEPLRDRRMLGAAPQVHCTPFRLKRVVVVAQASTASLSMAWKVLAG